MNVKLFVGLLLVAGGFFVSLLCGSPFLCSIFRRVCLFVNPVGSNSYCPRYVVD
jgi:hypothetical protein